MQLFSYLSNGSVRSGRLVGLIGIDILQAVALYSKSNAISTIWLTRPFDGLLELHELGPDGMRLVKEATDWVVKTYQDSEINDQQEGLFFEFDKATLQAPVSRPGKVICIAGNFPTIKQIDKPEFPTIFLKPTNGVIGDQQSVLLPEIAENVSCEVEVAVVIGKRGRNISVDAANSLIAGYTIANDLGDRVLEKRTSQWASGKMFDTFTPMGPILITPDELQNTNKLLLYTRVNGEMVQTGCTANMFFDIPSLISYVSTLTTLEPGDVLLTGSPKLMEDQPNPVCDLKPGDTLEVGIENLFSLTNSVVKESLAK